MASHKRPHKLALYPQNIYPTKKALTVQNLDFEANYAIRGCRRVTDDDGGNVEVLMDDDDDDVEDDDDDEG